MKIKIIKKNYDEVVNTKEKRHKKFVKPNIFFRTLLKLVSLPDLLSAKFKCEKIEMEKLRRKEPALILMNHSSFIDLEIAQSIFYPRPMNIVCTNDGFIGKNWLMRHIGCIPTPKFINDLPLVRNLANVVKKKSSILMFPEAGYSFDGTATVFPLAVAKLVKFLKIPVVTVITDGAYLRQPLYNELRKRDIKVKATVKYLLSKDDILNLSDEEIFMKIRKEFAFDNFQSQQENNVIINDKERAVGLERVLYKCPHCLNENMKSKDDIIYCPDCGVNYQLTENGFLESLNSLTIFNHVPDWYKWERQEVKKELLENRYLLDEDVLVYMMKDTYKIYDIGEGHLVHNNEGFCLTIDQKLEFKVPSSKTYTINSDFYWYQIGDIISIGDYNKQFYCFIKSKKNVVAKARLAAEEQYKIINNLKDF